MLVGLGSISPMWTSSLPRQSGLFLARAMACNEPWPTWTSFQRRASGIPRLLKQIDGHTSGTDSFEGILTLFHEIGETFGTEIYGTVWKWLEKNRRFRRLNAVPYLWIRDLREALIAVVPKAKKGEAAELFGR